MPVTNDKPPIYRELTPPVTLTTISVPVDLYDGSTDKYAIGTVVCAITKQNRLRGLGSDAVYRCLPRVFTGTLTRYSRGADGEEIVDAVTCREPLDLRSTADRDAAEDVTDDPAIPDSINDAIVEFVADAVKLTQDMSRSRALLAAAEVVKSGTPKGVWL